MNQLRVFVPGTPRPQGSLRAFKNGGVAYGNAKFLMPWRMSVTGYAREAMAQCDYDPCWPYAEAVKVEIVFLLERPKFHFGTGRNSDMLKTIAPAYPTNPPDVDKLQRAVLDGLTDAGVWRDDSQVVRITAIKQYAGRDDRPGAVITVYPIP